jgi:hypothetical protein
MIARLQAPRPRRFSAPNARPAATGDGGVRLPVAPPRVQSFDSVIRGAARDARSAFEPGCRPLKMDMSSYVSRTPSIDELVRARAARLRQRPADERVLVVPEHVIEALRGRV